MKSEEALAHTIYMVDEDESFRAGARQLLGGLGYVVRDHGEVESAIRDLLARRAAHGNEPCSACLLLDVDMYRPAEGLDASASLVDPAASELARREGLPMIYMSRQATGRMVLRAIREGVVSFLEKPFDERVAAGELGRAFLPGAAAQAAWRATTIRTTETAGSAESEELLRRLDQLTPQERKTCECMVEGKSIKATAREMEISPKTVGHHRRNVLAKMNFETTVALVAKLAPRKGPA